jgi:hypothetical protein
MTQFSFLRHVMVKMIFKDAEPPLEVVILFIGGMVMVLTGILFLPFFGGVFLYYENGLLGLLLIIFALQMIMLGRTPFGDFSRSKVVLTAGLAIAAIGMAACFLPTFIGLPRIVLFICFVPGGAMLFLQMCFAENKLRAWMQYGGIFRHLIVACGSVYTFSILIGLLLWTPDFMSGSAKAIAVVLFGAAIIYLSGVLWTICRRYPEAEKRPVGDVDLETDQTLLLLMGIFMLLLGSLLIPVSLGLLPFSPSAQLGLLMVIFAIQMLASGGTPVGVFPRSWSIIGVGLVFSVLGIISCIIPNILVQPLTLLVGVLNIANGFVGLAKMRAQRSRQREEQRKPVLPILVRLFAAQLTLNFLAILFGASMLFPGLVHGLFVGMVLVANGFVLLYLLHILVQVGKMRLDLEAVANKQ